MIYFTADHHFGHANIIRHCGREFTSVEEMDKYPDLVINYIESYKNLWKNEDWGQEDE